MAVQQLDGYDIQELTDMGFWSDTAAPLRAADGPSNRASSQDGRFYSLLLREGCAASRPFMRHNMVNVVEITQEEDFRIDQTIAEVIA